MLKPLCIENNHSIKDTCIAYVCVISMYKIQEIW